MELRHLRYFVAVAEEQNVTRAAQRLHMAQQPLSAAIKGLESDLGFDLFERVANRIRLTPAGSAFLEEARGVLAAAERAVERGRRAARGELGTLRVGYCASAMAQVLPRGIAAFRERYPAIALDLRRLDQSVQLSALERDEIDLAFIHRPFDERGRSSVDVLEERLWIALPASHGLARGATVAPRELAGLPLVRLGLAHDSWRIATDTLFAQADVSPAYAHEAADTDTAIGLVAAGLGACVVAEYAARSRAHADVAFVPVDTAMRIRMAAVWNERSVERPLRRRFLDLIRA